MDKNKKKSFLKSPNTRILLAWAIIMPAGLLLARFAQNDINSDRKKKLEGKKVKRREQYLKELEQKQNNES